MGNDINVELYSEIDTCRIDIKNSFKSLNSVKVLNCSDKNVKIDYPKWFKNNKGSGIVINSNEHSIDLTIKCINKGKISIDLKGPDLRDDSNQEIPYYINYTSFKINKIEQIKHEKLASHKDSFLVERAVRDGEIINIHIEWTSAKLKVDIVELFNLINSLKNLNKNK